jgi:hypothetical protein
MDLPSAAAAASMSPLQEAAVRAYFSVLMPAYLDGHPAGALPPQTPTLEARCTFAARGAALAHAT